MAKSAIRTEHAMSLPNCVRMPSSATYAGPIPRRHIRRWPVRLFPCYSADNGDRFRNCHCRPDAPAGKPEIDGRGDLPRRIVAGFEARLLPSRREHIVSLRHRRPSVKPGDKHLYTRPNRNSYGHVLAATSKRRRLGINWEPNAIGARSDRWKKPSQNA